MDELGLYVKDRVKALTGGRQHPVETCPQETRDIPIASMRALTAFRRDAP